MSVKHPDPVPDNGPALRDRIADAVRSRIISGEIQQGHRLGEEDLAERFGASRLPVREALTRLAAEGFVTLTKYRGATVSAPPAHMGLELLQIRRSLESLAAELAAERRGAEHAADLVELAAAGADLVGKNKLEGIPALVERFHELVALASGSGELAANLRQLRAKTSWLFAVDLPARGHPSWADHTEIAAAIAHGLPHVAAALMDRHVRNDERLYLEQLQRREPLL
jgi:DNA-binding GntR family transcriptional regulator